MKLGCHVSNAGKDMLLGSVNEAVSYGANGFMVYLGAPQNSYRKDISELKIPEFKARLQELGMFTDDVIVHAPYIINLAQDDDVKRQFAIDFIVREIKTMDIMGAKYLVIHPGAYLELGLEKGLLKITASIKEILKHTPDSEVVICLETMAGKGTECCHQFEQLKYILDEIASNRVKVCLDTCHTFDSGYDWINDYEGVMEKLNQAIGLDQIKVIHVNDSKNMLGSRKDRHENIGFGNIGFTTLNKICHDERFKDVMKILETPYIDGNPPYQAEIAMIKAEKFNPNLLEDVKKVS